MAVTIDELAGSPRGKGDADNHSVVRDVVIDWADINTYIAQIVPSSYTAGENSVNQLGEALYAGSPYRVASYNWTPFFDDNADTATGADANGIQSYGKAKFTITYTIANTVEDEDGDPVKLLSHNITGGGQFLQAGTSGLFWDDTATALPEGADPGVFVGASQHSVGRVKILAPPWFYLDLLSGSVNDRPFRLRGYWYYTETVLYTGYSATREVLSDGQRAWDYTLHFDIRSNVTGFSSNEAAWAAYWNEWGNFEIGDESPTPPTEIAGHNHVWKDKEENTGDPGFVRVYRSESGAFPVDTNTAVGIYDKANLNLLF